MDEISLLSSSRNIKSTPSTRWGNEPNLSIRHPKSLHNCRKLPKVLIWKDLHVSVPAKSQGWSFKKHGKNTQIIKGVSGVAEPGQLLSIMGESGAGKTTLLNTLTRRFKSLHVEGEINVNGEVLSVREMNKVSAYVQQFDLFMGSMTVHECLLFSAYLRMGHEFTDDQRIEKVEEVIGKMGLNNCRDTLIGQKFSKSISLGEKKRLSFACEILNDPSIIFADEPTSGLDAYMAKQVILYLKKLATEDGVTVILTIHQPSSQIFEIIDRVCFMSCGQVTYLGPTKKVPAFFASLGFIMPDYTNPAEYAIKTLSIQEKETSEEYVDRIDGVAKLYFTSALAKDYRERTHGPISERRKINNEDIHTESGYNSSWFIQFCWLFKRAFFKTLRDPLMIKVRILQILLTTFFISLVYFKTKISKDLIINGDGLMFKVLRDLHFIYMFPCILVFTEELPIFLRENHARIYRTDAYFVAKNLAEIPQFFMMPLVYCTIIYFTTSYEIDFVKWMQFSMIGVVSTFTAISVSYLIACVFARDDIAVQILPMINFPLLSLAGFFIKLNRVRFYFKPLIYISMFKYSYEALMINFWSDHGQIPGCENDPSVECTGFDGKSHLEYFGFHTRNYVVWTNLAILVFIALVLRTIALFALKLRSKLADA